MRGHEARTDESGYLSGSQETTTDAIEGRSEMPLSASLECSNSLTYVALAMEDSMLPPFSRTCKEIWKKTKKNAADSARAST